MKMRIATPPVTVLIGAGLVATSLLGAGAHGQDASEVQGELPSDAPVRLESIFVGDKEQPAISYFIPWEGVGAPDKLYWNMEGKHDQSLGKVDREIMLRSIQLYEDLQLESPPR